MKWNETRGNIKYVVKYNIYYKTPCKIKYVKYKMN